MLLGGKGLGSKANFERLEALAEKLGASCGCTRPVAMAGWASYDKVVGLSGSDDTKLLGSKLAYKEGKKQKNILYKNLKAGYKLLTTH